MNFKRFMHEIHRRSLGRVLGVYVLGGGAALALIGWTAGAAGLPDLVFGLARNLLLLGLPLVMATAFVQNGASLQEGKEEEEEASDDGANLSAGTGSLDRRRTGPTRLQRTLTWRKTRWAGVAALMFWVLVTATALVTRASPP